MKNSPKKWSNRTKLFILHGVGVAFACFFGMVAHDLARALPNFFGHVLFPANLSLWEQGKILLTGMSIWFIIEYFIIGRKIKGFIFIHTIIAAALPIVMLIIYLSHSQVFGDLSTEGAHIILAVALILVGFTASTVMVMSNKDYSDNAPYGVLIYVVVIIIYVLFTYLQPNLPMFYDEIHKVFGPAW